MELIDFVMRVTEQPFSNILPFIFWVLPWLIAFWCMVEFVFWWYIYRQCWVPRSNQRSSSLPPHPYHRHPEVHQRHLLLQRIASQLLEEQQDPCPQQSRNSTKQFLFSWFQAPSKISSQHPPSSTPTTSLCSDKSHSTTRPKCPDGRRTITTKNINDTRVPGVPPPPTITSVVPFWFKSTSAVSDRSTATTAQSSETESVASSTVTELEEDENGSCTNINRNNNHRMSGSDGSPEIVDRLDECYTDSSTSAWTIPEITKESMDKFLAWALFAKDITTMSPVELEELDRCYQVLYEKVKLTFHHHADGASVNRNDSHRAAPRTTEPPSIRLQPRLLSLEDVSPWHRPLALYILVMMGRVLAGLFLRLAGFQRAVSTNGVVGWYRPGQVQTHLPLLFFHGIAPAGLLFYIPLVLWGLLSNNDDRPCFLFENPNISCRIQFDALDEQQTVDGVQEIVEKYLSDYSGPLSLCGHSFGSCQLTWMLILSKPGFRQRLQQFVLLDPVTILLYEPDVLNNFLYSRGMSKIRLVAGSELFVEHFLRRHFAWYNAEVGLDELLLQSSSSLSQCQSVDGRFQSMTNPPIHAVIALSGRDEIVNAPKVQKYIDRFVETNQSAVGNRLRFIYWPTARHAACVTSIRKWRHIKMQMLASELDILRSTRAIDSEQR